MYRNKNAAKKNKAIYTLIILNKYQPRAHLIKIVLLKDKKLY